MNLQQLNSKLEKMEAVLKANEEQIAVLNEQKRNPEIKHF